MRIIDGEAVLHPNPQELLDLGLDEVLPHLQWLWRVEADSGRPELETVMGAGQLARIRGVAGVQESLAEWIRERDEDSAWDVAGCFLMGFWVSPIPVNGLLFELLIDHLDTVDPQLDAGDSIIRALGQADSLRLGRALRGRLRAVFRSLWDAREHHRFQPKVKDVLRGVLDQPNARG